MARIWSMMDIGKRSMMNSQTGMQTIGHNIANKSTEGYSRQRVEIQAADPTGVGKLRIGNGAMNGDVKRINNEYMEKQLEKENNQLGLHQSRSEILGRVEQVFNEQINKGLNQFMGEFFNSFRELANNPESLASRTLVKETADHLTKDFARVQRQLGEVQADADYRVSTLVEDINATTREIAKLNEKIPLVEIGGGVANDERDRRDLLVKKLSERINIKYVENEDGLLTVTAGNNAILVSSNESRDLFALATPAHGDKREGNFDIFYKATDSGSPLRITEQITSGQMGGLLNIRDKVINEYRQNVDQLAYTLAKEVNKAHRVGYDQYSRQGQNFFSEPVSVFGAAENLKVNKEILEDVAKISAAAAPNSPADNRIANILSAIQYKKALNDGSATLDDYYSTVVGRVGIETTRSKTAADAQKDIVKQLGNIRESISGVSLDEETTKMIEFQKTYDASARLIRTADEMLETVLNLKRL